MGKQKCCVKGCKEPGMKHVKHGKAVFLRLCEEHTGWLMEALHRHRK